MVSRVVYVIALAGGLGCLSNGASAQNSAPRYYNPAWAPDGRYIVFESTREGESAIFRINADGTGLLRLTALDAESSQPNWSPDGKHIVFTSTRDGHGQLYTMDADGGHQTRLTNTEAGAHFYASYSPDGSWVTFGVQKVKRSDVYYVFAVRTDGSQMVQLTDSTHSSEGPHWSAAGKSIVFTRVDLVRRNQGEPIREFIERRNKTQRTISLDLATRKPIEISTDSVIARSANGKTIFFVTKRDGEPAAFVANADGSNPRRLADPEAMISFSPDGRQAVYSRVVNDVSGIYVLDLASGKERLIAGGLPR